MVIHHFGRWAYVQKCCPFFSPFFIVDNKHDGCMYLYEKEFSGTLEGQDFAGVTESGVADTPVFASLEDAQMGKYVFGRVQASFECIDEGATCFGIWNIYDAYYHSWISFRFGFGEKPTANTIVGGTGVYAGITGEVSSKPVSTDPPIFEFAICHY